MKNEFTLAFNEVLEEKQLPKDVIINALEAAMVSAYRREVNASNAQQVEAKFDLDTGKVSIYAEKEIVEIVEDPRTEVSLVEAQAVDANAKIGGLVTVDTTPQDFGRVAAQTARQVIQQRLREAERDTQLEYFTKQVGEILSGVVQTINPGEITMGLDMKAEGTMPHHQQIIGERFRIHDRVRALLLEVKPSPRGPELVLSRAHRNFLRRMLENEVPEIYHGMVEIRSIAREPGQRSKVAVAGLQPGVDPVGACVGVRGVRIQAIVGELHGEKIDVIEWNPDPAVYIAKALSPARVNGVYLNEQARGAKTATVVVPEDQLSLAIGRDGQNARLAAKLTGWRIDIKSLPEAVADALHKLQFEAAFALQAAREADVLPQIENILTKKTEGRPITPEEYAILSQFVDRVERAIIGQRQAEKKAEKTRRDLILTSVPVKAFDVPLEDLKLNERLTKQLSDVGYLTIGDLMLQMRLDSDMILKLNGIGPKAIEELQSALDTFVFPEEKAVEIITAEVTPEAEMLPQPEIVVIEEIPSKQITAEVPTSDLVIEVAEVAVEETQADTLPVQESILSEGLPIEITQLETKHEITDEKEKIIPSLDELLVTQPEVFEITGPEEEEDEEDEDSASKKKKKKKDKKKFVEVVFDPDAGVTVVKRKRKRGSGEWGDTWDF